MLRNDYVLGQNYFYEFTQLARDWTSGSGYFNDLRAFRLFKFRGPYENIEKFAQENKPAGIYSYLSYSEKTIYYTITSHITKIDKISDWRKQHRNAGYQHSIMEIETFKSYILGEKISKILLNNILKVLDLSSIEEAEEYCLNRYIITDNKYNVIKDECSKDLLLC